MTKARPRKGSGLGFNRSSRSSEAKPIATEPFPRTYGALHGTDPFQKLSALSRHIDAHYTDGSQDQTDADQLSHAKRLSEYGNASITAVTVSNVAITGTLDASSPFESPVI